MSQKHYFINAWPSSLTSNKYTPNRLLVMYVVSVTVYLHIALPQCFCPCSFHTWKPPLRMQTIWLISPHRMKLSLMKMMSQRNLLFKSMMNQKMSIFTSLLIKMVRLLNATRYITIFIARQRWMICVFMTSVVLCVCNQKKRVRIWRTHLRPVWEYSTGMDFSKAPSQWHAWTFGTYQWVTQRRDPWICPTSCWHVYTPLHESCPVGFICLSSFQTFQ